ncbi:gamma carbonic anhydrase family protein [Acuticoccus mangrovi]|uniref:Gamma carbonic anhydrase family protein n=1 Tax=Acuticoccus mangrovi TaxID=2796142 RepID=A0A934IGL4_9HYPH|nr:gamma carbonic anhydrase family protein [Acuticoccus mangrovi]MBJ3776314.1 gamma carbonic anhydrase family protein [Acuticoccus mangrovi]
MALYSLEGVSPDLHIASWAAPTAVLIGRVRLLADASVWWGAVVRGDNEWIEVGEGANIQDNTVCHTDAGAPLTIGAGATVGHSVILHGCTIGEGSLVGMGATVLNHAVIGKNALVGANALVPEGKVIPDGVLALGAPAKVIRELTDEEIAGIAKGSEHYVANWKRYKAACLPI